jgi:hypothetical protein
MKHKSPKARSKKLHQIWGLGVSIVLILFALSGILLNHRALISACDMPQKIMPVAFQYQNWNNGALRGSLDLNDSERLLYGGTGIWRTDATFSTFEDFNAGLERGADNRKIFDLEQVGDQLYAATQSGLYVHDGSWKRLTSLGSGRFVGLTSVGDRVFALSRSDLFVGRANGTATDFERIELPAPSNYTGKVSLFETIWQMHSGEIAGMAGRLFVDLLGVVTILLSVTGLIYFFAPRRIKNLKGGGPHLKKLTGWAVRHHRQIGLYTFSLLIVLYVTGAFLRPPLLIPIAGVEVAPIPFSNLAQSNPWHDRLRDLCYNPANQELILAAKDGLYRVDLNSLAVTPCPSQPPLSVMGINVLRPAGTNGDYLVGSFTGLYRWNPDRAGVFNVITREIESGQRHGPPIGQFKITGYLEDPNELPYFVEYSAGVLPLHHSVAFSEMPPDFRPRIALWSAALEFHTARIFSPLIGPFYILIVPLTATVATMVCWSGFRLLHRKTLPIRKTS